MLALLTESFEAFFREAVSTRREGLRLAQNHAPRHQGFHNRPRAEVGIESADLEGHHAAPITQRHIEFGITIHARACGPDHRSSVLDRQVLCDGV